MVVNRPHSVTVLQTPTPARGSIATPETRTSHAVAGDGTLPASRTVVRKVCLILLSAVAVLLLCEAVARILVTVGRPVQGGSRDFDSKYAIALSPSEHNRPTIFCVGDSLISRAIYAELLSARLRDSGIDVNVRNLAVCGSCPGDECFLLKRAIDSGVWAQAVIYDVTPVALKADPFFVRGYSARLSESYIGNRFLAEPTDLLGQLQRILCQNSYLVGYRGYIKEQLQSTIDRACTPGKHLAQSLIGKIMAETSPCGWAPAYTTAEVDDLNDGVEDRPAWPGLPNARKSNPISPYVYERGPIKEFCAERGIPLIFVWLPAHPLAAKMILKQLGMSTQDCQRAFASAAKTPGTWFLDLHDIDQDPRHFMDLTHLNAAGAIATTERLSEILKVPPLRELLEDSRDKAQ